MRPEDRQMVKELPIFGGLSQEELDFLLSQSTFQSYPKGSIIFHQGDVASHFFVVIEGWIKIFRGTEAGRESVLGLFTRGEAFAIPAVFDQGRFPASAMAVETSQLVGISKQSLLQLIRDHDDVALRLISDLSRRLREKVNQLEQLNAVPAHLRVAEFLLTYTAEGSERASVRLPVEKTLIAARLGMAPETLSRALARLRSAGVETSGLQVEIQDKQALERLCGHRPR